MAEVEVLRSQLQSQEFEIEAEFLTQEEMLARNISESLSQSTSYVFIDLYSSSVILSPYPLNFPRFHLRSRIEAIKKHCMTQPAKLMRLGSLSRDDLLTSHVHALLQA